MMQISTRCMSISAGLLLMLAGAFVSAHADSKYSSVVAFGDSMSDPGNAWVLTGVQSHAPYELVPDAAYAIGGHHFSNGRTWIEQLAHEFSTTAGPAFKYTGKTNYAVGGARARSIGVFDLTTQVQLYQDMSAGVADNDTLYTIMIGGNDVRDAMQAFALDPSGMQSGIILQSALNSIYQNIAALAQAGAKHFLISTSPDLALVPAVRSLGPQAQYLANYFSSEFNNGLAYTLFMLNNQFDINVTTLDIFALLHQVVASPAEYDFDVVDATCINPGVVARAVCSDPDDYLFWDGIHPTRAGHREIAHRARELLSAPSKHTF